MREIQGILLVHCVWASRQKTESLNLELEKLVQYCWDKDKKFYKQRFVGMKENSVFSVLTGASL